MYPFLHELLSDRKGGEIFTLFGLWHFLYIALTVLVMICVLLMLRNRNVDRREHITAVFINVAFCLYILDFFLMPLAYSEIDIEKLPFHACTAMCVMCFFSYRVPLFAKYRTSFAMLGFVSNLVYLIYPAGVMWHAVHPLSYRVIQTLLFHSVMTIHTFLVLIYAKDHLDFRTCCSDLMVLICMTLWAMLGNSVYNGNSQDYSHFFNWFFVVRDPFYVFPETVAPWIMPPLNVALFFAVEMILRWMIGHAKQMGKQFGNEL